jgi:hypothetical protein
LGRITDGNNYLEVAVTPQISPTIMLHEVLPGDFSASGAIDAGDYVFWREAPGTLAPFLTSYDVWRTNYGSELDSSLGSSANVPEPTSLLLLFIGSSCLMLRNHERAGTF